MPRTADWIHRLSDILVVLREFSGDLLDRSALETLFQVSPRQATRILRRMGAQLVGGAMVIGRAELIRRLESMSRDETIAFERERRARLAQHLDQIRREARGRRVVIPPPAKDAPPFSAGVQIQSGCLQVRFHSPVDLIQKLMQVASEASRDWEQFESQVQAALRETQR